MSVDIVNLIESNPITTFSGDYQSRLIEKIKNCFTNYEQQMFLSSFYCYLKYDPKNDFVIDLDNIWKWLDFSQKIKAKQMLEKNFTIDKDYKLLLYHEVKHNGQTHGGHNREIFMLNVDTFKKFCLKAGTKKADEIHEYFIKLENIMFEIAQEECVKLKEQMLHIETNIVLEKQKAVETTLIKLFPINTECVYFGSINDTNEQNEKLIKFGHTNNLHNRCLNHRKDYNNFILLEAFKVQNKVEIENLIKNHPKIKKQIRNIMINGKHKTEIIAYDENFTINDLTKIINEIINSKTYSIDNFNKLLQQNEELSNENKLLQSQIKTLNDELTKKLLEIEELSNKLKEQDVKIQLFEKENQSIGFPILKINEQTSKFDDFIVNMCIVRPDIEESSVNLEGAYRIWNRTKPTKEIFHAFKEYLDVKFKPGRLSNQDKNQVVNGYIGVKLKSIEYKKKYVNNSVETFIFQVCAFTPSGKILNSTLNDEYKKWKEMMGIDLCDDDLINIKQYLNSCEYVLKATVWTEYGSNEGYYGLCLKKDINKHKKTSSTGKSVRKIDCKTKEVLCTWETIAKASVDENVSAAKLSRSIKNKVIFNNDYYYETD